MMISNFLKVSGLVLSMMFISSNAFGVRCEDLLKNSPPRVDIEALFHANENGQKRIEIENFLEGVESTLLREFEGWNDPIRNFMSSMRAMYLDPTSVGKPIVVPLMSFPGYGKTTVIQRVIELMGWGSDIVQWVDVAPGMTYLPYKEVLRKGHRIGSQRNADRPVDWVLVVDEVQRMTTDEALRSQMAWHRNEENAGKVPPREFLPRDKLDQALKDSAEATRSKDTWWPILGNGILTIKPTRTSSELISEVQNARQHLVSLKSNIDNRVREIQKYRDKAAEENRELNSNENQYIVRYEQENQQYADQLGSVLQNFVKTIDLIREEHTHLLEGNTTTVENILSGRSTQDLIKLFESNSDEFVAVLRENNQLMRPELKKDFKRGIVFLAGNPEIVISRINEQLQGTSISPDNLHRVAKDQPFVLIQRWFESLFGNEPAIASRLNLNRWRLIPPFNNAQWVSMVRRRLSYFHERLTLSLSDLGVGNKFDIEFDKSVEDLLMAHAVDPLQGPRVFMESSSQILASFAAQLPMKIRRFAVEEAQKMQDDPNYASLVPEGTRKLTIRFVSETSQIEVVESVEARLSNNISILRGRHEDTNERAILEHRRLRTHTPFRTTFEIGLPNRDLGVRVSTSRNSILKSKQALYQAARSLVGSIHFESVPKEIDASMVSAHEAIENMWGSPDSPHLHYMLGSAKIHMAGYLAELRMMPDTTISDYAKLDLLSLQGILLRMKEDLDKRQALASFLQNRPSNNNGQERVLPRDPYVRLIYEKLIEDRTLEIFETILQETNRSITQHQNLIEATASYLNTVSPIMDAAVFQATISNYFRIGRSFRFLQNRNDQRTRALLLSAEAGALPSNYTFVSTNYRYQVTRASWYVRALRSVGLRWW